MKKTLFTFAFVILFLASFGLFAQTIRRCNNNAGITGVNVYTTIQDAHDAASAGDIIYVEPSVTGYGSLSCSKPLTIIGNGYFIAQNSYPTVDTRTSIINSITFESGSANTSLKGIYTTSLLFKTGHIILDRCFINGSTSFSSAQPSHITFSKCFITDNVWGYDAAPDRIPQYCTFTNNIISGSILYFSNSIFVNNTFATVNNGSINFLLNSAISNNIFRSNGCNSCTQQPLFATTNTGTTISNNIIAYVQTVNTCIFTLPSGNGNVNGANYSALFLVEDPYNIGIVDKSFQLAVGSPAIGVGTGGTNAGAFGGASPYVLSGLPSVPITTNYGVTGAGNNLTPLQVHVEVRSNN